MKASVLFSVAWVPCNIAFLLLGATPTFVISFVSAVLGYYVAYFLPIAMALKAGDSVISEKSKKNTLLESEVS